MKLGAILIANRGEIACRIIRTAKTMGYKTIAVYSEADAQALHVRMADYSVLIGPAPVGDSYLNMDRVLQAAKESGAGAVHPGYGFLSENADFARACADQGLIFIGPPAGVIDLMGNKAAAKRRMIKASVPCVPGYEDKDQSDGALMAAAEKIGYPVMVKAAAGGGGRGMRLVDEVAGLADALASARSEALNAFGSDELILERGVQRPRHVEIQVFADAHGNLVHLGERDCSVQRRHQKVIEEAPCPVMTPELRGAMGAAAVKVARGIGYQGAGTVEFLLDANGAFYFLEMNVRLQVEHPVTEMITGLDLVALQLQVAEGRPLGFEQGDVRLNGHAIEARLYAEDPARDFLPATGRIDLWQPAEGAGLRYDSGIESGSEISPIYDPMMAKVVAWGETRDAARRRLICALGRTVLFGPATNRHFLMEVLGRDTFAAGQATTAFLAEEFSDADMAAPTLDVGTTAIASVIRFRADRDRAHRGSLHVARQLLDWTNAGELITSYTLSRSGGAIECAVSALGGEAYRVTIDGEPVEIRVSDMDDNTARLDLADRRIEVHYFAPWRGPLRVAIGGCEFEFYSSTSVESGNEAGGGRITAPMHGQILDVLAASGDTVRAGDRLAVLEAMKMQHDIVASVDGIVREVQAQVSAQVAADDLLFDIEVRDADSI